MNGIRSVARRLTFAVILLPSYSPGQVFPAFTQTQDFSGWGFGVSTTRGWQFTVTENLRVEQLGFWDGDLNGLQQAHSVGIWRDHDMALLTSATVPAGTAAPLEGTFRWVPAPPVVLRPGETYVIGAHWAAGSPDTRLRDEVQNLVFNVRVQLTGGRSSASGSEELIFPDFTGIAELNANFKASALPDVRITDSFLVGTGFTIRFTGPAGVTGWKVMGSGALDGFHDDRTADSVIVETSPGVYQAVIGLGSLAGRYFIRIEQ